MSSNPPPPNEAPKPASNKWKGLSVLSACLVLGALVVCAGAIATPKFAGFQCKSKQSEAKTNLSGIFTAQKVFHAEYGTYTTDLVALNWAPDGNPIYAYGFAAPSSAARIEGVEDHDPVRKTSIDPRLKEKYRYGAHKMQKLDGSVLSESDFTALVPAATATSSGFLAAAIGDIDADGDVKLDVWTIDDKRELRVIRNDCTD